MPPKPSKTYLLCSLLLCLALQPCLGQGGELAAAISIKPTTDFDQRFYYTNGEKQNVWGYRVGVLVNDKYKLGLGGYYMNRKTDRVPEPSQSDRSIPIATTYHKELYLSRCILNLFCCAEDYGKPVLCLKRAMAER